MKSRLLSKYWDLDHLGGSDDFLPSLCFRMDVTNNDLPWHFTIDKIPALIFFPAER